VGNIVLDHTMKAKMPSRCLASPILNVSTALNGGG